MGLSSTTGQSIPRSETGRIQQLGGREEEQHMANEADTCRKLRRAEAAGGGVGQRAVFHRRATDDYRRRIVPRGRGSCASRPSGSITCLRYRRDMPLAVVEAKAAYKTAFDGVQQARHYAEILGLKFAYATNGHEHDRDRLLHRQGDHGHRLPGPRRRCGSDTRRERASRPS